MNSKDPIRRVVTRRRPALSLPKRRHHLSLALIALIILIATPMILAQFTGDETDAKPKGSVTVATLPPEQMPSPLDAAGEELPDLLADLVPAGENPTDALVAIDALGNRTGTKPQSGAKTIVVPAAPKPPPLDPSLTRSSRFGPIPGPNRAGQTPLGAYKLASPSVNGRRPVAIIVGGLGINGPLTQRAIIQINRTTVKTKPIKTGIVAPHIKEYSRAIQNVRI